MKTFFIEAKYKKTIRLPISVIKKLPKELALFTTTQFIDSIPKIKQQLEKNKIKIKLFKPKHCKYKAQILGCSIKKFPAKAFLYIGNGMFHPFALKLKNNKPVFIFNPFSKKLTELKEKDVEKIKKQQKGALLKFYNSKNIGILVSTKPGQNNLKQALKLKQKLKNKNCYILIADTIDNLENFSFIDCFINTACPRIPEDKFTKPIINMNDLPL